MEGKFAEWTAHRSPKRRFVRLLGPEDLEARITPANTDLWLGIVNTDWSNANNWSINGAPGVPQNGDTLQFGGSVGGVNGLNTPSVDNMNIQPNSVVITGSFNQTITLSQPLQVNGSVTIASTTSPTIAGKFGFSILKSAGGAAPTFSWGAGTLSAPTTFSASGAGGTLTINGSNVTLNNTLTNYGTITWSSANPQNAPGPNIAFGGSGSLNNNGTFNIQTSSTESITGVGGGITNGGIMQKTGANTTQIAPPFNQTDGGKLTINSGTLAFGGFSASGAVVLDGGNLSSKGILGINPTGFLSGVGTITASADVYNQGTVTPGVNNVPGTLTIVGDYIQTKTGNLIINIDAAGNTGVLNVQGWATLGGGLNVNKNPNYTPSPGTVVVFLNSDTLYGDFSSISISNNLWETSQGPVKFEPFENYDANDYELIAENV